MITKRTFLLILCILALGVFVAGCTGTQPGKADDGRFSIIYSERTIGNSIEIYHDGINSVTIYDIDKSSNGARMAAIPDWMLKPPENRTS